MTELAATSTDSPGPKRPVRIGVWVAIAAAGTFAAFILVGLFTTVVVPRFFRRLVNPSQEQARADILEIDTTLETFAQRNGGKYPATLEQLVIPDENGKTYLGSTVLPKDPWGTRYRYELPGPGHARPRVLTYGLDGRPGGEGDSADIDNFSLPPAK